MGMGGRRITKGKNRAFIRGGVDMVHSGGGENLTLIYLVGIR